jgi:gluconolactonase
MKKIIDMTFLGEPTPPTPCPTREGGEEQFLAGTPGWSKAPLPVLGGGRGLGSRRRFLRTLTFGAAGVLVACAPAAATAWPVQGKVVVLAEGLNFPEGPAFDPQGRLWCTELSAGNLIRLDGSQVVRYATDGSPNGLAFDHQGRAWVPDSKQMAIRRFDPASEQWETLLDALDGQPLQAPNDLSFDAQGNLLFTCPNFASEEKTGCVVCLRPDGTAKKVGEGFYRPNGLDIVDGGKALVVADTFQKTLFKGAWDAAQLTWADPQPWARVGGSEGPDGMVPGADGLLYQAIYGDGVIRVVDAQGNVAHELALPGKNPTNAAIDPSGKLGLVVTETEKGQLLSLPWIQTKPAIFDGGAAWK